MVISLFVYTCKPLSLKEDNENLDLHADVKYSELYTNNWEEKFTPDNSYLSKR